MWRGKQVKQLTLEAQTAKLLTGVPLQVPVATAHVQQRGSDATLQHPTHVGVLRRVVLCLLIGQCWSGCPGSKAAEVQIFADPFEA